MQTTKTHWMLCAADDFASARGAVLAFFEKSILLSYDDVRTVAAGSYSGAEDQFWKGVEEGITANRLVLGRFLDELRAEGCRTVDDLTSLPLGYPSKILHLIAHLVDGFIGIDSVFYNLVEDSHWLSNSLRNKIHESPQRYWLIQVEASFLSAEASAFLHLSKK